MLREQLAALASSRMESVASKGRGGGPLARAWQMTPVMHATPLSPAAGACFRTKEEFGPHSLRRGRQSAGGLEDATDTSTTIPSHDPIEAPPCDSESKTEDSAGGGEPAEGDTVVGARAAGEGGEIVTIATSVTTSPTLSLPVTVCGREERRGRGRTARGRSSRRPSRIDSPRATCSLQSRPRPAALPAVEGSRPTRAAAPPPPPPPPPPPAGAGGAAPACRRHANNPFRRTAARLGRVEAC